MQPIIHLKKTKSTNIYLRDLIKAKDVKEGTIVYADYQTEGRGQRGNAWESEAGRNLLFSIVLYPRFLKANEQFILSQIVSLAIKDFLSKRFDDITIKWPNDIYWRNQKIAGILIENQLIEDHLYQSIIGVGLNVNQIKFRSDATNPVSIRLINNGQENDRSAILSLISYYIQVYYDEIKNGQKDKIIQDYKDSLFRRNGYYEYIDENGYFTARIKDVEPNGMLILEKKDGEIKRYAFKEVQYIL